MVSWDYYEELYHTKSEATFGLLPSFILGGMFFMGY